MTERPLLMIPGPVEISPAVAAAFAAPPPSHVSPGLIEAFGTSLERMREVWRAAPDSRPLVVGGGGTVAMDIAVANLIEPGDRALVVQTGYFSDRMAEMLRRAGAEVTAIGAEPGDAPAPAAVAEALDDLRREGPVKALFATHVDTSTGVRIDPEPLARLARAAGALSVFDGVCATAGERFEMAAWDADLYLTGSQKALGLPAGLALLVAGERAVAARAARRAGPPPMYLDWDQWLPIMAAYEARRPSYFSTPATNLILALEAALGEIVAEGIEARVERHRRAARALRAAWRVLGLAAAAGPRGAGRQHAERPLFPARSRSFPGRPHPRPRRSRRWRPPPRPQGSLFSGRTHGLCGHPARDAAADGGRGRRRPP